MREMNATNVINGFSVRPGLFLTNGATIVPGGISFTIHSVGATGCELCLFRRTEQQPYAVLPFPEQFRIGNTWSMIVFGLDITEFEYAYTEILYVNKYRCISIEYNIFGDRPDPIGCGMYIRSNKRKLNRDL